MTEEEMERYVKENFLKDAISSIKEHGRYWNSSIPRTLTSALSQQLEHAGFNVTVWEIPPQWEHVFYLQEDTSTKYRDLIMNIAEQRYSLMENGTSESLLPK